MREWSNFNEYPHKVFASVLLLDGKIYDWKIKNTHWEDPNEITMRISDFDKIPRMEVKWTSFTVNNDEEHNRAFEEDAREWYKQWEVSEHVLYCSPYGEDE